MPRENDDTSSSARLREAGGLERRRHDLRGVEAVQPGEKSQVLAGGQLRVEVQFVGEQPDPRANRRAVGRLL